MSDVHIGYGEVREFNPTIEHIDWEEAWIANHEGEIQKPVWIQGEDELGELCHQLHQENCCFYINDTNSEFDAVIINDPRDTEGDFWLTRFQMGSDNFDDLYDKIGSEVMVVFSKYPPEQVGKFVLKILSQD